MQYEQFAYVYDQLMADMPYQKWLQIVQHSWNQFGKPHAIAELGCGTGSLTTRLATDIPRVYGIDYSADMLSVATRKESDLGLSAQGLIIWLEQDMRQWEVHEPVDAVYSFCDSLNYMTEQADLVSVFQSVYKNLKPHGVFMFDMLSEYQFASYAAEQPFFLNEDELAYIWTCEYDQVTCIIEHELSIFAQKGSYYRRIDEFHQQRAYSQDVIKSCLIDSGFKLVHMTADFTDSAPITNSARIFYTAVRTD